MFNIFRKQFSHTNSRGVKYYLWRKKVSLRGGKEVWIYFFTMKRKVAPAKSQKVYGLPAGKSVNENPRNGFLTIRTDEVEMVDDDD